MPKFLLVIPIFLVGCAQIPPPAVVGQQGEVDNDYVEAVDIDSYPPATSCSIADATSADGTIKGDEFLYYAPMDRDSITINCEFEDGIVTRTIERTLAEVAWEKQRNMNMVGALVGGGIFGFIGAAFVSPPENFYFYSPIINVGHTDLLEDEEGVATIALAFESKWQQMMQDYIDACTAESDEESCLEDYRLNFYEMLKARELEYLYSFSRKNSEEEILTDTGEELSLGENDIGS